MTRRATPSRGFYGIGIVQGKTEVNFGTLMRHAMLYDAAFVFTVGRRYPHRASDTANTRKHVPMFEYDTFDALIRHLPFGTPLVGVELDPRAVPLGDFEHPERACYVLGAEDHGLTAAQRDACHYLVQIESPQPQSMNVAVAGSLLLYDRHMTRRRPAALPVSASAGKVHA